MRDGFHRQLDLLTADIAMLCHAAGIAMSHATEALLCAQISAVEEAIGDHRRISAKAAEVESIAYRLLALESPVASDLRAVVTSMQHANDADRMGALALHVAEAARRRHPQRAVPQDISIVFADMAAIAVQIGSAARDVVLSGDPVRANQLRYDDDRIDSLHRGLFGKVMDPRWSHGIAAAIDVTLLSRYYERFADHAVDIGVRAAFQYTGCTSSRSAIAAGC
ncbi:PhoU domain-containing protein [Mycolicibacterium septicum]|uniref:phosphate signaling complex PhoU family protein n=1 Tax=Mycolicibacterium septicum TaxID=98668 RepID=UPI0023E2433B|nr:PhoU domain-containing protein [Mycolicibacterium septicum]MDF3341741.1 PhoU domain-containing protein [Mycolicibacterium septicum]